MQIRLLTTINYGNIGAYSDKMLHTPEPCTRLHAGLLQRGRPRREEKGRRTEGVILVHPQGPSRRNARGLGGPGGGDQGLNQNALLCEAHLLPQLAQVAQSGPRPCLTWQQRNLL